MRARCCYLVCLIFVLAGTAHADVVVLKNGDRLSGTVDSIVGGRVVLETEYAGPVPIKMDAVESIETETALDFDLGDNSVAGTLSLENGTQTLTSEAQSQPIELSAIQTASQNKLTLTDLGTDWESRADLSAIVSNGNSSTESYNTLIETTRKNINSEHKITLLVSNETAEDQTTKDVVDLDYAYKRFLSEKWYASGNGEYFQDRLKDVDQRITLGAGMGYQFWDNSLGAFSTELGISAVREDLNGDTESNPAIRWGLAYNRFFLAKRLELFHKQSILFIPDSDRGEVLASSTGVRFALSDRIDSTARVDLNHETDPPEGSSSSDVTYTVGIGIKF